MQTLNSPTQVITVTADMVDALIQQHPEDAARINRGVALVGSVERTNRPGVWLVYSASEDNRAYTVDAAGCSCPNYQRVGGWCKHRAGVYFFQQAERLDAEQSDPTPDPDDDTYYCVLCEEPIPAAEVVETRWGFMHERCAMTEPRETDEDARYELPGRAHLALVPTAALPAPIGTFTVQPTPAHLVALADELFGGDAA